jgi:hypothetical protein
MFTYGLDCYFLQMYDYQGLKNGDLFSVFHVASFASL